MTDLPKQIDKRLRREVAALPIPWELIKKRDHYFLRIADKPLICMANNASKRSDWQTNKTLARIKKILTELKGQGDD